MFCVACATKMGMMLLQPCQQLYFGFKLNLILHSENMHKAFENKIVMPACVTPGPGQPGVW